VRETDRDRRMEIAGGRTPVSHLHSHAPRRQAAGVVINGPRTVTGGRRQRRELPRLGTSKSRRVGWYLVPRNARREAALVRGGQGSGWQAWARKKKPNCAKRPK
jgi:hypothetical protein